MNNFPAPDSLTTLAIARETYGKLLAAFHGKDGQTAQLEADLKAANELVDETAGTLSKAQDNFKAKTAELEQAQRDLGASKQAIETLEAKVEKLEGEAKSAEAKAAEICASVGVDPLTIKPDSESKNRDIHAEFEAITDPARQMAFFRKHKEQLLSRK